jgi:hypothetical protein
MQIDKEGTAMRDGGEEGRREGIELGHLRQARDHHDHDHGDARWRRGWTT